MIRITIVFLLSISALCIAQSMDPRTYDMGNPSVTDIWVDPVNGQDTAGGADRQHAVKTVDEAWSRIPMGTTLNSTGYRIQLVAGSYSTANLPNYWESRYGTFQFPVILQAADGRGTAVFMRDINMFDCRYLYLLDFNIIPNPPGDAFHCEQCDHLLVRGMTLSGGNRIAQETVKVNQSQYVYIEDSEISGAWDNAIDFVAVQYGHVQGNRIHDADDWCEYAKGGSAYLRIESNEYFNCGTGGFTAGQGSGFEFLSSPWLHYEAYDIKFLNNLIHDTDGAGIGVNGGYNILMAYNTMYRVGARSHVIEVVFGSRTCDGNPVACGSYQSAGGWGPSTVGPDEPIPDRNVYIYNNIVYNPAGYQSQWQHLAIYGPRIPSPGTNIPSPATTDTNLRIRGNVIWNGPANHPLGIEDPDQGCQPGNSTCNATQLVADNTINTLEPELVDPANGNFRPASGGNLFTAATFAPPDFPGGDRPQPPVSPEGNLANSINRDLDGAARPSTSPPGAYFNSAVPCVLTCSAGAPGAAPAGSTVQFSASASATNCGGVITYDWDFGDTTPHSAAEDPTHIYALSGTYNWGVTVTAGSENCVRGGAITISDWLFFDDFEDQDFAGWTPFKGSWQVLNGDLEGTTSRKAEILPDSFAGPSAYTVEGDVRIETAGGRATVLGWYVDKRNYVELTAFSDKGKWVLKHHVNGVVAVKGKVLQPVLLNTNYHVRLSHDGGGFQVGLDGASVLTLPSGFPAMGNVGFRVKSTTGAAVTAALREIAVY